MKDRELKQFAKKFKDKTGFSHASPARAHINFYKGERAMHSDKSDLIAHTFLWKEFNTDIAEIVLYCVISF